MRELWRFSVLDERLLLLSLACAGRWVSVAATVMASAARKPVPGRIAGIVAGIVEVYIAKSPGVAEMSCILSPLARLAGWGLP